jgi:chromosome partitioning protein
MIVTVMNCKGGVGKTTTAGHLAAYLNRHAPTLLLDSDESRNAITWAGNGKGLGFKVMPMAAGAMFARDYVHTVIDSAQAPSERDLEAAAQGSHLLVIPAVPKEMDTAGLVATIKLLQKTGSTNYRVLLTRVAHHMAGAAKVLREELWVVGAPVFEAEIPELKVFDTAVGAGQIVCCVKDPQAARAWAAYEAAGKELGV